MPSTTNLGRLIQNILSMYLNLNLLIEDYNIKYLPNIDTFMNLERSNKTRITSASKFLGVGDPKFLNKRSVPLRMTALFKEL